ncbi:MAG TPA: type II toxin-antitoxin system HicA family toxin [Candidatus Hydrogenedentes bacterium]|nr:type II toxin-antitoxin system HicA family toxin [Candidatus Hydrogenedentota bacterium]
MSKLPSLSYREIIRALQRDGWTIVRQRGSHIRLHKHFPEKTLKLVVPAHVPVKRGTLHVILKQAQIDIEYFLTLL